ncbi:MAG: hypothetical protein WA919_12085 [Coleofasciculaceae cyanobacterium]
MKVLIKAVGAGGLLLLACLSIAAAQEKDVYRGTVSPNSTQHAFIRKSKADKTLLVVNALALGGAAFALVTWIVDDLSVSPTTEKTEQEDSQPESNQTPVLPSTIPVPEVQPEQIPQSLTAPPRTSHDSELASESVSLSTEETALPQQEVVPKPPQIPEELLSTLPTVSIPETQDEPVAQAPLSEDELLNSIGNPRI